MLYILLLVIINLLLIDLIIVKIYKFVKTNKILSLLDPTNVIDETNDFWS